VLAMRNSYHGRTYATMGVTGNRGWSASGLSPLRVSFLHSGDRLRGLLAGRTDDEYLDAAVTDLREVMATTTSGDVACLIAEPVQGVGGFTYPPDGLFAGYRKVLDEYGVLFIADEVQTGWGRTGAHFWGYQAHGVIPDLLTFAKGIGNGLALGGVVGRAEVMNAVHAVSFSTFGGNPFATAGGNAVLDYLLDHDLQANAARVGDLLLAGHHPAQRVRHPARVRGVPPSRIAGRQGRSVWQRTPDGPAVDLDRRRGARGFGNSYQRHSGHSGWWLDNNFENFCHGLDKVGVSVRTFTKPLPV